MLTFLATWNDFWLNEGFTSYFEYRIMEALEGREYVEMLWLLGKQGAEAEIADLPASDTHLRLDYSDRDPDAVPSLVYDKGALFLRHLEENLGRKEWDAFLTEYFDRYAFKTTTSERFLGDLKEHFADRSDWIDGAIAAWVDGPGIPEDGPEIVSPAFAEVDAWRQSWLDGGALPANVEWVSQQWVHFVRGLPDGLPMAQIQLLDRAYGLSETGNSEVLAAWLTFGIKQGYEPAWTSAEAFVTRMGRAKFLRPIYRAMCTTSEGCDRARAIYAEAKPGYHSVSVVSVDHVFEEYGQ